MPMGSTPELNWRQLMDLLLSPDPTVRDGWALEALAQGILSRRWVREQDEILDRAITQFSHSEIQGRAFAPLILCWLMQAGSKDRVIFEVCAAWYLNETDERGYDQTLGWLHSVAHGADALGYCAQYGIATGDEVLTIFAQKISNSKTPWEAGENERIVAAIIRTLDYQPETNLNVFFEALPVNLLPQSDPREPNAPWQVNLKSVLTAWFVCLCEGAKVDDRVVKLDKDTTLRSQILSSLQALAGWLY